MKKICCVISLVGFFVSLSVIGCGRDSNSSGSQPIGSDIIQQYNFHLESGPTTTVFILPQQLNDANWGLKETLCEQGGYTLIPYAGGSITAVKYSILEKYSNEPLYLWVLAKDYTTICGYLAVRENSVVAPGVFALSDPNITYP